VGEDYTDATFANTVEQDGMTYDKKIIRNVYIRPYEANAAVNIGQDIEIIFKEPIEEAYKNVNK